MKRTMWALASAVVMMAVFSYVVIGQAPAPVTTNQLPTHQNHTESTLCGSFPFRTADEPTPRFSNLAAPPISPFSCDFWQNDFLTVQTNNLYYAWATVFITPLVLSQSIQKLLFKRQPHPVNRLSNV